MWTVRQVFVLGSGTCLVGWSVELSAHACTVSYDQLANTTTKFT